MFGDDRAYPTHRTGFSRSLTTSGQPDAQYISPRSSRPSSSSPNPMGNRSTHHYHDVQYMYREPKHSPRHTASPSPSVARRAPSESGSYRSERLWRQRMYSKEQGSSSGHTSRSPPPPPPPTYGYTEPYRYHSRDRSHGYESQSTIDEDPAYSPSDRRPSPPRSPVESLPSRREGYRTYSRRQSRREANHDHCAKEHTYSPRHSHRSPTSSSVASPTY